MSLLYEAMEGCTLLNKVTTKDTYGGFKTVWVRGPSFNAAFSFDTSMQARRASKEGVKDLYTVTTDKSHKLTYGDVLLRKEDNKTYRVTSNGKDKKTPDSAGLDMSVVTVEQWDLPQDEELQNG